ncbi:MAG TPA: serine esterase, partial [bacterium]|nr:serine esterase [bacterium]
MDAPHIRSLGSLFVPAAQPSSRLMVVLHGLGDSLEGFVFLPELLDLPWMNYLLVNAPQPYFMGYAWFDLEDPAPGILSSRARLQGLLEELQAQGWPGRDLLLLGFSQGCLMAVDVALRHAQPLAGIVGISGFVGFLERAPQEMHPQARQQAWLITHGTLDPLLPIARTRAQFEQLRGMG